MKANRPPEAFTEPLMEFIPRVTPRWEAPLHLKPYIDVLERAPGAGLRIVFAAPPQHGKTESATHAFSWWLKKWPHLRYAYATYSASRAERVGRLALNVAHRSDVQLDVSNLALWITQQEGQILWTSIGGELTGSPIDGAILIDDPLKDRKEAESPTIRQNHKDWYDGSVETRVHPGASVIVMATRWNVDDLSGWLVRERGFTYINLKAIADDNRPVGDERQPGEALWQKQRPLSMLLERQSANAWNFASLYQGEPRPRGGALFREPARWTELPVNGFRVTYGIDLSYSEKTLSDFSVCVEIWAVPPAPRQSSRDGNFTPLDWTFFIVDVQRKQVEAPSFTLTLKAKKSARNGRFFWYASGTEKGSAQFIRSKGIPLLVMDPAGRDKFTRAQPTSELWNAGRILVPDDSERYAWVDVFVDELTNFTGVKDVHDDQVDALVSGIDAALKNRDTSVLGFGDSR